MTTSETSGNGTSKSRRHSNRYGGLFFTNTEDLTYNGTSIADFVDMETGDRMDFFYDHPDAAFGMLQDLAEYTKYREEDEDASLDDDLPPFNTHTH